MGRPRRSLRTHLLRGGYYDKGGRHLGILYAYSAELCNGSTYDSDSYCLGSNPSSAARIRTKRPAGKRVFCRSIRTLVRFARVNYAAQPDELVKELMVKEVELANMGTSKEEIIKLRFYEGKTWKEIAERTLYCTRQCKRIGKI